MTIESIKTADPLENGVVLHLTGKDILTIAAAIGETNHKVRMDNLSQTFPGVDTDKFNWKEEHELYHAVCNVAEKMGFYCSISYTGRK